jgi:hypothetical protein
MKRRRTKKKKFYLVKLGHRQLGAFGLKRDALKYIVLLRKTNNENYTVEPA